MKKFFKGLAALGLSSAMCLGFFGCAPKNAGKLAPPDGSESYSILTKLDLWVDFDGDTATAKVKNTFTFFPATASVHVYLYYSENQVDGYTEMTEVATGYIYDLDQGETLCAEWDTKGRGGYFTARMRYKIDAREWEERQTDIYYRDYTKAVFERIADDGSLPEFEDIQPVYRDTEPAYPFSIYSYEEIFLKSYMLYDATNAYSLFSDDYIKEFGKSIENEFFVFNLKSNDCYGQAGHLYFGIYKDDDKIYLCHNMMLDDDGLGHNPALPAIPPVTGFGPENIYLAFIFVNVEETNLTGKLKLQFGRREKPFKTAKDKFINLYIGDNCIGTCYYSTKTEKEVTYAYFYNLFVDNLTKNKF